jgi:hypothetical protein
MDDSCVSVCSSAKRSSPISGLNATTCRIPVPSRSIRKNSLPPLRALYTQPSSRTTWLSWRPMSAM